ncbi:hypothetical protein DPMN_024170 [Dreissena polymorpha]|uniref:Uncharacterized protein n=1 Tax=Dreissena polymorpha TaxID=45954 RepID=A0A9D4LP97_DREPO|nr:hypothetical protein DPMN_024170 [Dreissena polymorpha]
MTILNNPLNANIEEKKNTLYQQYVAISSELVKDKKWNIKIQKPLSVQKTVCDVCQNNDPRKFEMDESSEKFCLICSTQHGGWEGLNTFLQGRKSIGEYLRESLTFLWNWHK